VNEALEENTKYTKVDLSGSNMEKGYKPVVQALEKSETKLEVSLCSTDLNLTVQSIY